MLSHVARTIREHRLIERGDRVLVGLSGGADSTALLHALLALSGRSGFSVAAVCIDHGLRAESADEAERVVAAARAVGVEADVVRVEVERGTGSLQDAARRARLGALAHAAQRRSCRRVALGHNADDQAETVLFRIVRGTGVTGLAGIPYARPPFVRPLLDLTRAQIRTFLEHRRIPWVEDPSNEDRRFARVRMRHDWLPALARENPRIREALVLLAADARARATGQGAPLSSLRARRTLDRLRSSGGTRAIATPGGRALVVSYGQVSAGEPFDRAAPDSPVAVTGSGLYRLVPGAPAIEVRESLVCEGEPAYVTTPASRHALGEAWFDPEALAKPLAIRTWQPGDRMRPRGGRGSRKLQDLFVDAKISRPLRHRLPVLVAADGEVLFVPGLRPSEIGRPTLTRGRRRVLWVVRQVQSPQEPFVDQSGYGDNTCETLKEAESGASKP